MGVLPMLQTDQLQHLLCDAYVGDPGEQTEGCCLSFLLIFWIIQPLATLPLCKHQFKLQNTNFYRFFGFIPDTYAQNG